MAVTQRGGARRGSGRAVRDIQLSPEAAKTLKLLIAIRQREYGTAAAAAYVMELIEADWQAYDAGLQAEIDKAEQWDGEVL